METSHHLPYRHIHTRATHSPADASSLEIRWSLQACKRLTSNGQSRSSRRLPRATRGTCPGRHARPLRLHAAWSTLPSLIRCTKFQPHVPRLLPNHNSNPKRPSPANPPSLRNHSNLPFPPQSRFPGGRPKAPDRAPRRANLPHLQTPSAPRGPQPRSPQ